MLLLQPTNAHLLHRLPLLIVPQKVKVEEVADVIGVGLSEEDRKDNVKRVILIVVGDVDEKEDNFGQKEDDEVDTMRERKHLELQLLQHSEQVKKVKVDVVEQHKDVNDFTVDIKDVVNEMLMQMLD